MSFSVKEEKRRSLTIRRDLLRRESQYVKNFANSLLEDHKSLSVLDYHYYRSVSFFTKALLEFLDELENAELALYGRGKFYSNIADIKGLAVIERGYEVFPHIFQSFVGSYLQRKEKFLKLATSRSSPYISLHELHPAFHVSMRAIEAVNIDCFSKTKVLLKNLIFHCPPIVLGARRDFKIHQPLSRETEENDKSKAGKKRGKGFSREKIVRNLSLRYISVPRWAATQIHHVLPLTHESLHVAVSLASRAMKEFKKYYKKRDIERFRKRVASVFDDAVANLAELHFEFVSSLFKYFKGKNLQPIKKVLSRHAEEIICDIGGFVISGPAYALSLLVSAWHLVGNLDKDPFQFNHPPISVRLKLFIQMLKWINFDKTLAPLVESAFSEYYEKHKGSWNKTTLLYEQCLEDREPQMMLYNILDFIGKKVAEGKSRGFIYRPNGSVDEQSYLDTCSTILKRIEEGDFLSVSRDFSPLDLLNAMWAGDIKEGREINPYELDWKTALIYSVEKEEFR